MSTTDIDIAALVDDGHLDLDDVFSMSDWDDIENITSFTACVYGRDGDEPGDISVDLQHTTAYGITAWRWLERDAAGSYERGPITLDRQEAVEGGKEYADENDDPPDYDSTLRQIVATGYFGDSDATDISLVCSEATRYSQGYLLLPKGYIPRPLGVAWTVDGYLEQEHVQLPATYGQVEYAACALLGLVTSDEAEEEIEEI
jgi:hypothetical protein